MLAAVERLGHPVMADLRQQFPDLAPSAIKRVLDALKKKGRVAHAGDDNLVYLDGVHWWSTALTPTEYDNELAAIVASLERAGLGLSYSADLHDRSVTVRLPLVELESHLRGLRSGPMDRLRSCVEAIEAGGRSLRLAISTRIASGPEPLLAVELRPAGASA